MERETLRPCSEKEKKKKKKKNSSSSSIIRCSFSDKDEEKEKETNTKKKMRMTGGDLGFSQPLIMTLTKTTTTTIGITMISPPEHPNHHVNLYLCFKIPCSDQYGVGFQWCKIDPTNTNLDVDSEEEEEEEEEESEEEEEEEEEEDSNSKRRFLTPISTMPNTTPPGFCAIPHLSTNQKNKKKKLVYAIGGCNPGSSRGRSAKAFICDFGASTITNPPVWEQLPDMPWPMGIYFGVASPLNGNVYAFGGFDTEETKFKFDTETGVVFDPASRSWNQCPHPFKTYFRYYTDAVNNGYALVQTKDRNQLIVFNRDEEEHVAFDLTTGNWESSFYAPNRSSTYSSSVAVGDVIYRFIEKELYAIDLASKTPRFKRVYGLEEDIPTTCFGTGYIAYLGKGKLCIVWGAHDLRVKDPFTDPVVNITCLMFWVGVCNQMNQLRAVVDRCEHYAAHGLDLTDVVAL